MLRRPLPLAAVLAAVVVLTTGCAGGAPAATRSATATATVAPLVAPTAAAGEVTRSTSGGAIREPAGRTPASGAIAVEVACSGVDGSTMRWSLVAGDGTPLGLSGDADCSGPATTSSLGLTATRRPATVRVRLLPDPGVVAGYAIVRPAAF